MHESHINQTVYQRCIQYGYAWTLLQYFGGDIVDLCHTLPGFLLGKYTLVMPQVLDLLKVPEDISRYFNSRCFSHVCIVTRGCECMCVCECECV